MLTTSTLATRNIADFKRDLIEYHEKNIKILFSGGASTEEIEERKENQAWYKNILAIIDDPSLKDKTLPEAFEQVIKQITLPDKKTIYHTTLAYHVCHPCGVDFLENNPKYIPSLSAKALTTRQAPKDIQKLCDSSLQFNLVINNKITRFHCDTPLKRLCAYKKTVAFFLKHRHFLQAINASQFDSLSHYYEGIVFRKQELSPYTASPLLHTLLTHEEGYHYLTNNTLFTSYIQREHLQIPGLLENLLSTPSGIALVKNSTHIIHLMQQIPLTPEIMALLKTKASIIVIQHPILLLSFNESDREYFLKKNSIQIPAASDTQKSINKLELLGITPINDLTDLQNVLTKISNSPITNEKERAIIGHLLPNLKDAIKQKRTLPEFMNARLSGSQTSMTVLGTFLSIDILVELLLAHSELIATINFRGLNTDYHFYLNQESKHFYPLQQLFGDKLRYGLILRYPHLPMLFDSTIFSERADLFSGVTTAERVAKFFPGFYTQYPSFKVYLSPTATPNSEIPVISKKKKRKKKKPVDQLIIGDVAIPFSTLQEREAYAQQRRTSGLLFSTHENRASLPNAAITSISSTLTQQTKNTIKK